DADRTGAADPARSSRPAGARPTPGRGHEREEGRCVHRPRHRGADLPLPVLHPDRRVAQGRPAGSRVAAVLAEPGRSHRLEAHPRLRRRVVGAHRHLADQLGVRDLRRHGGPRLPRQPRRLRAVAHALPRPGLPVRDGPGGHERARGGAAHPQVPHRHPAGHLRHLQRDDPAAARRRGGGLHHEAVLRLDPHLDRGGGTDRRSRVVPHLLVGRPADVEAGAHHADDPELPGLVERVQPLPGRHAEPGVPHAGHRAREPDQRRARLGHAVPTQDGSSDPDDHPGGRAVLQLPALLRARGLRGRRQGL
ncbi:MAG: ABC transporter, permease protein 2 (cluster 1, maltose/g3p/polyamine/iron), partial [uncultured Frankineae bacterium]